MSGGLPLIPARPGAVYARTLRAPEESLFRQHRLKISLLPSTPAPRVLRRLRQESGVGRPVDGGSIEGCESYLIKQDDAYVWWVRGLSPLMMKTLDLPRAFWDRGDTS